MPGGYKPGDKLRFKGKDQVFSDGDRLKKGAVGVVMGPVSSGRVKSKGLAMHFHGNNGIVNCYLTWLEKVETGGGFRAADEGALTRFMTEWTTPPLLDEKLLPKTECEMNGERDVQLQRRLEVLEVVFERLEDLTGDPAEPARSTVSPQDTVVLEIPFEKLPETDEANAVSRSRAAPPTAEDFSPDGPLREGGGRGRGGGGGGGGSSSLSGDELAERERAAELAAAELIAEEEAEKAKMLNPTKNKGANKKSKNKKSKAKLAAADLAPVAEGSHVESIQDKEEGGDGGGGGGDGEGDKEGESLDGISDPGALVDRAPESDDEQTCIVCFDAPKTHLATPCGHQCVCAECASKLGKICPYCREEVYMWVKQRLV